MLTVIPFCNSSEQVINYLFFKYPGFLLEDKGMSNLFKKLKYYEFQPFVLSIIFSFLKITYIEKEGVLRYYDWAKIVPILVKPDQTFSVLNFFIKLNVFGFLIKTKSMREFIIGVRLHLSCFNIPDDFSWNLIGFDNLLQFLKVDKSTRNFLIKKTHHQKNFEELKKFFNSF